MEKKYIIKLEENEIAYKTVNSNGCPMIGLLHPAPYTEPDLDAVKKEAYQQGHKDGYNKHDTEKIRKQGYDKGLDDIGNALRLLLFQYSNYTLQEIFGYDTARAVVEHFEGSEIVARIRCYEGGVKQDAETIRKEAYEKGYEAAKHECEDCQKIRADAEQELVKKAYDTAYADADGIYESGKRVMYQKGLKDAWDAARTLWNTPNRKEIFGHTTFNTVLTTLTAQETIEKIRQYEQKQEKIKVGDEVITTSGKAVVMGVGPVHFEYVNADGSGYDEVKNIKKTGRHFPEIEEVLAKMKESE